MLVFTIAHRPAVGYDARSSIRCSGLGGIGIIPGAMMGGIIGIVEAMVSGFLSSTFRDAAAFGILILILLYKPAGLLGKNIREKV